MSSQPSLPQEVLSPFSSPVEKAPRPVTYGALNKDACVYVAATTDHHVGHSVSERRPKGTKDDVLTVAITVTSGAGKMGGSRRSSLGARPLHQPFPLPWFIFFYCTVAPVCGR